MDGSVKADHPSENTVRAQAAAQPERVNASLPNTAAPPLERVRPVEAPGHPTGPSARALPRTHHLDGERLVGRLLRMGAIGSGTLFASSLLLGLFEPDQTSAVAADILRKAAGSILLVTPVVRLIVGGTILGLKGEWRYALYAGAILFLLAIALGTGAHV